jgi:hypothetical protein
MAPIGLAHRPTPDVRADSGHGDPDRQPEPEARLLEIVEQRRAEARAATQPDRPVFAGQDEPSADGWLAGEPMF